MTTDEIDIRIEYEYMSSPAPSEASGTFDGYSFYFYARWDACSFTISRTEGILADALSDRADYDLERTQSPDYPSMPFPEHLVDAFNECFHVEREIPGGTCSGSYLDEETKKQYIRQFCALFDRLERAEHKELLPGLD